eukprot:gb/GEZN01006717.1/.p1 GENE.gb/GEZN01006717.1/~~gb/GEZN01006717.1/.p1  ORF type:complete len:421 (-),score=38.50 gb/GEZN01006717.1/:251-1513(-)
MIHFPLTLMQYAPRHIAMIRFGLLVPALLSTLAIIPSLCSAQAAQNLSHAVNTEIQDTARNLTHWLKQVKASPLNYPNRVFFQHFSKAGGTSLCKMARANMRTNRENNCNLPKQHQHLFLGSPAQQLSIPTRFPHLHFLANEQPLSDDFVFLPGFFSIILVREPVCRARSSFLMRNRQIRRLNSSALPVVFRRWINRTILGNFYVRHLNGITTALTVKRGVLDRSHLAIALSRLDQFSLVWLTEWYFLLGDVTRFLLGWTGDTLHKNKAADSLYTKQLEDSFDQPHNLKFVKELNELDYLLYSHAISLSFFALTSLLRELPAFRRCFSFRQHVGGIERSGVLDPAQLEVVRQLAAQRAPAEEQPGLASQGEQQYPQGDHKHLPCGLGRPRTRVIGPVSLADNDIGSGIGSGRTGSKGKQN